MTASPQRGAAFAAAWALACVAVAPAWSRAEEPAATEQGSFDVVIAGGSTAALAAAFTAADEGARVALLEPTDWIGGQLTASGVPAVDEAWHKLTDEASGEVVLDVSAIARDPRNMTPWFRDALLAIGNPGRGWVSRFCFPPRQLLEGALLPQERRLAGKLRVFRRCVVKRAEVDAQTGALTRLVAIQRTAIPGSGAERYTELPSKELPDWYSPEPSQRFDKRTLSFRSRAPRRTVFIDATEWGELLVLAGAEYLQGVEPTEDSVSGNDRCGQAITYGFVQRYNDKPVRQRTVYPKIENLGFGSYRERPDAWSRVWTYRRLLAAGEGASAGDPNPGDLSLQNWGYHPATGESGNDYPGGYFLLPRSAAAAQRDDWLGGVDLDVLAAAERQAYAWHEWYRHAAPAGIDPDCFTLDRQTLGAEHGLSLLPYIRDTRRAVGIDGFRLKVTDLIGPAEQKTGARFPDRVALGAYAADIHPLAGGEYPDSIMVNHATLPFYIPYRSLTVQGRPNLMVAGKTMAQTFLANSATRLHPIEWSSGCAAGAAAALLASEGLTTREGLQQIDRVREAAARHTPVEWTIAPQLAEAATRQ